MSLMEKQEFGKLCRVCESIDEEELIDISTGKSSHLIDKLYKIADFESSEYNCYLRFICTSCASKLEHAFKFKIQCEETHKRLINQINQMKIDEINKISMNGENLTATNSDSKEYEDLEESNYFEIFEVIPDSEADKYADQYGKFDIPELPEMEELLGKPKEKVKKPKKTYTCAHCGKTYKERHNFSDHINIKHLKFSRYNCKICGKVFKYNTAFYVHRKAHFDPNYKKKVYAAPKNPSPWVSCDICGKTMRKTSMANHLSSIHPEAAGSAKKNLPYLCQFCGIRNSGEKMHEEHLLLHSGIKSYQCAVCGKTFAQKNALTNHLRFHSDKKPYRCTTCPKAFKTPAHLNCHVKIHNDERDYKCLDCGKAFRFKHVLKLHMRIHTGDTPYQCPKCSKKLAQKRSFVNHVKKCTKVPAEKK